jgi:hypothetical protein
MDIESDHSPSDVVVAVTAMTACRCLKFAVHMSYNVRLEGDFVFRCLCSFETTWSWVWRLSRRWPRILSSRRWRRVVSYGYTDVSEVLISSTFMCLENVTAQLSLWEWMSDVSVVFVSFTLFMQCLFLLLIHQSTYSLNKIYSEASIKLLHVSASGCHHQGVTQNKAVQGQHAYRGLYSTCSGVSGSVLHIFLTTIPVLVL